MIIQMSLAKASSNLALVRQVGVRSGGGQSTALGQLDALGTVSVPEWTVLLSYS